MFYLKTEKNKKSVRLPFQGTKGNTGRPGEWKKGLKETVPTKVLTLNHVCAGIVSGTRLNASPGGRRGGPGGSPKNEGELGEGHA